LLPRLRGLFPPRQRQIWHSALDTATTLEKGHGRQERRTLSATTALNDYLDWPGVAQVGRVESTVDYSGKSTTEARYFITSAPREITGAAKLLECTRGHWTIENKSHYVRDVTLGEDASRIRKAAGPQVMAALRNVAVGILRTLGVDNIAAAMRRNAARVDDLFSTLGILKR
jgi:Transposase DDE domain